MIGSNASVTRGAAESGIAVTDIPASKLLSGRRVNGFFDLSLLVSAADASDAEAWSEPKAFACP
jgi:hypothetical protein